MPNDFKYDVFLSHSAKDEFRHGDGMRELANQLKRVCCRKSCKRVQERILIFKAPEGAEAK